MAASAVLYVGDDICHRIPVMERAGIVVLHADCSVVGVRSWFAKAGDFSAVAFHNDLFSPQGTVVTTARELSRAPLILFKNPAIDCDDSLFDLVISVPAPPDAWSKSLKQAIEEAHQVQEYSRQLRQQSAAARDVSRSLRALSMRNGISPIDYDALFRAEADGPAEDPDDGKS